MKSIVKECTKSILLVLTICISFPTISLEAKSVDADWVSANNDIVTEKNINEYLSSLHAFDVSTVKFSASSKFNEKDNAFIIENKENAIQDQWVEYSGIDINGYLIDVKILIIEGDLYPQFENSNTNKEYIKINKKFDIYQYGYQKVDYRIEFYESGTNNKVELNPIIDVNDIDLEQTFVANGEKKSTLVSEDSSLEARTDGTNIAFTAEQAAENSESNRAVYTYTDSSSIDFSIGMNRDQTEYDKEHVYGSVDMNLYAGVTTEGIKASTNGSLELMTVDENGSPLSNAKFQVTNIEDKQVYKIETNNNGYAKLQNLPYGQYSVVQVVVPSGYILDNGEYVVNIKSATRINEVNLGEPIINQRITGSAKIKVIDEKGSPVSGAEFAVFDELDNKIETIKTNGQGEAVTKTLDYGSYKLYQTKAPSAFSPNTTTYHFSITKNQQEVLVTNPPIVNTSISETPVTEEGNSGYIEIQKYGANAGEQYFIYDEDGNLVQTLTLDENGYAISSPLGLGNYTLVGVEGEYSFEIQKGMLTQKYVFEAEENSINNKMSNAKSDAKASVENNNDVDNSLDNTITTKEQLTDDYSTVDSGFNISNTLVVLAILSTSLCIAKYCVAKNKVNI